MCQVETVLAQIMSLKQHEVETVLQQLNDTVCCVIQMKTKILSLLRQPKQAHLCCVQKTERLVSAKPHLFPTEKS